MKTIKATLLFFLLSEAVQGQSFQQSCPFYCWFGGDLYASCWPSSTKGYCTNTLLDGYKIKECILAGNDIYNDDGVLKCGGYEGKSIRPTGKAKCAYPEDCAGSYSCKGGTGGS